LKFIKDARVVRPSADRAPPWRCKLHLENNEDFEKLYVAILQFVLKGIFLETLKEEKICFPEKHSFD
jgi:hypothetical protein